MLLCGTRCNILCCCVCEGQYNFGDGTCLAKCLLDLTSFPHLAFLCTKTQACSYCRSIFNSLTLVAPARLLQRTLPLGMVATA